MLEKKIRRYKLMDAHRELVKTGKLREAQMVLHLLRKGSVKLGLGDDEFQVECLLEKMGCRVNYSRNGYSATFYI